MSDEQRIRAQVLRELAAEFFYENTFDKLIASSPDPITVVIADELERRARELEAK